MEIGRKIYYELSTGNVIVDTGERSGDVVDTTVDQDFAQYSGLQPYQRSAVGIIQLNFGDNAQNFAQYPYHVDVTKTPQAITWDTSATDLSTAQSQKKSQLRNQYLQTLASGFNVTIGGTQYTFGWTTDDKATLDGTQTAVSKGFLAFPIQYADVHGNPLSITDQTTLDTIEHTAANFFNAQHQQVLNLIGEVNSATSVDAVNVIQWSPASY